MILDWAHEVISVDYPKVIWYDHVWFTQCIPKHAFILWVAIKGRLKTKDRIAKWFTIQDQVCHLCKTDNESHSHLFFACEWTCRLWTRIKSWLRIGRTMQTLASAIRGLHSQRNNLEARMKRVSLGITVYLIWEERNKRVFDGQSKKIATVFRRF